MDRREPDLASEQIPSSSHPAERMVVGSIMAYPASLLEVTTLVNEESFYFFPARRMFAACEDLIRRGCPSDSLAVCEWLLARGELADVGGPAFVHQTQADAGPGANAAHFARVVRDHAIVRALTHATREIARSIQERSAPAEELVDRAAQAIFGIEQSIATNTEEVPINRLVIETLDDLRQRQYQGGGCPGVPTGLMMLDELTGGIPLGEFTILAARPSVGKSAFAGSVARNVAKTGTPVVFLSLEMPAKQLILRMLALAGEIDLGRIMHARLTGEDWARASEAQQEIMGLPLTIYHPKGSMTVGQIGAYLRTKARRGCKLAIIDYIQIIKPSGRFNNANERMTTISNGLMWAAQESGMALLVLSQMNRAIEGRGDRKPMLSDLRDSGSLEQDANTVMFLHRTEAQMSREAVTPVELTIAKCRNGSLGTINLDFHGAFTRYEERAIGA